MLEAIPTWYLPMSAGVLVALASGLLIREWWLRHRAPEEPEPVEEPQPEEPDHGVQDDETTVLWLAAMHQPGELFVPEEGSDEWWRREFDTLALRLDGVLAEFDAGFHAAIGEQWSGLVAEQTRQRAEWWHRVEAGVEDTAEWAVVPRQMAQVQP